MKILKLVAENIKKIKAVEIEPNGNLVEITGKNGSGKTSILDAIWWTMKGLANVQDQPIRNGEDKAMVQITLESHIITRTFKRNEEDGSEYTSAIKVENRDGTKVNSPQTLLDSWAGIFSFEPLAFMRADDKAQIEQLKSLVPGFNFVENEEAEKKAYDERTVANRKAREATLAHVSFKDVPTAEPPKVEVNEITKRLAEVSTNNDRIREAENEREKKRRSFSQAIEENERFFSDKKTAFEKLKAEFEKAQSDMESFGRTYLTVRAALRAEESDFEKTLAVLPAMEDANVLKNELDDANQKNAAHDQWAKKMEAKAKVEQFEAQSSALTKKIEELVKARLAAIEGANLPIAGLSVLDNTITLNGIPLKQGSDAEQLRTSIAIAMAMNPTLKVIRVRDGSLLDEDGMKLLAEMANKNDYQIWIERVDGSGKVGFVIEDGSLKN